MQGFNKVLALGFGNMSSALVRQITQQGVLNKNQFYAVAHGEKSKSNIDELGIETFNEDEGLQFDAVFLGLKPQAYADILPLYKKYLKKGATIISMMAGVPIDNIQKVVAGEQHYEVVRIMPNTPCAIGHGVVAVYAEGKQQHEVFESTFKPCGEVVFLEKESDLHLVTALSGSGPAYFYYIMESMVAQAKAMGLDEEIALSLVASTCSGAGEYVLQHKAHQNIMQMREQVTSKGGTTAAGVSVLIDLNVKDIFSQVVQKAYERSKKLGS